MRQNKWRSQYSFNIPFSFHSFGLTFLPKDSALNAQQNHKNESNGDRNKAIIVVILLTSIDINFKELVFELICVFLASETLLESFKVIFLMR